MKSMSKFLMISGFLIFSLLSACNNDPQEPSKDQLKNDTKSSSLDRIQSSGKLRVGYFLFEPTIMRDGANSQPYGLFVDMVEKIAKDLRWEVEYKQVDLKNFAAALQAEEFDLSIGATFSSPNRASGVAFTTPIFHLGYTGVTTKGRENEFQKWSDVDREGIRVAVKQGSAIGDYVSRNFKNATIVALEEPGLSGPLAAVPGQADIGLMNQITVFSYMRDNPEKDLIEVLTNDPKEFTGISWAVKHDDDKWLRFINTSIKHFQDTGLMQEWEAKYKFPYLYHERKKYFYDTGEVSGEIAK